MMLEPVFDRPQFKLTPDTIRRMYATIDNGLMIYTGGRDLLRPVLVPAEMFTIMDFLRVPVVSEVRMYLDDTDREGRMIFGVVVDDDELFDLWHVSKADMQELIRLVP